MFLKFDTEQFLRGTGVVDEQGNARPGFESHAVLQRALDVYEETIVAAGTRELDMMLELTQVMARTTVLNEVEGLLSDTVGAVNFGPIYRYVRGFPE